MIDELVVCEGEARIDLALVNGSLIGYEIKSEKDTLSRLGDQVRIYSRAFDKITIVASTKHLAEIERIVPSWWGITEALDAQGRTYLGVRRPPECNPSPDPFSIAQLLWRQELIEELTVLGVAKGLSSKTRRELWRKLADTLDLCALRDAVRRHLKAREDWLSSRSPLSDDGPSRFSSM